MKVEVSVQQRGLLAVKEYLLSLLECYPESPFLTYWLVVGITGINGVLLTPSDMMRLQIKMWTLHLTLFAFSVSARVWTVFSDLFSWVMGAFFMVLSWIIFGIPMLLSNGLVRMIRSLPASPARDICLKGLRPIAQFFELGLYIGGMTLGIFWFKKRNMFDNWFDLSRRIGYVLKVWDDSYAADQKIFDKMDLENAQRLVKLSIAEGLDQKIDEENIHALIYEYCGPMRQFEWKQIKQRRMDEVVWKRQKNEKKDVLSDPRWNIHIGQGRLNYLIRNGLRFQWALMERDLFIPLRLANLRKSYPSFIYQLIRLYYFLIWSLFLVWLLVRDSIVQPLSKQYYQWSNESLYFPRTAEYLLSRRPRTAIN